MFAALIPYLVYIVGLATWLSLPIRFARNGSVLFIIAIFVLYTVVFVVLVGLTPSDWIRAKPVGNLDAEAVIILGYGYGVDGDKIIPDKTNLFLMNWALRELTRTKTLLVQEGIKAATDEIGLTNVNVLRIHAHDPHNYVNTLEAAYCAIQKLRQLQVKKVILVAHDLQLRRAYWDFRRVSQRIYPDLELVVPQIPDSPYPSNSVHWQTQNEFIYKIVELMIARPRDTFSPVPIECKAP